MKSVCLKRQSSPCIFQVVISALIRSSIIGTTYTGGTDLCRDHTLSGCWQQDTQCSYTLQHWFARQLLQTYCLDVTPFGKQQPFDNLSDHSHIYPLSSTIILEPCIEFRHLLRALWSIHLNVGTTWFSFSIDSSGYI
jgi:hypothetical protein